MSDPNQIAAACTLGVGCDETGVCYASAHNRPEQCGRSAPLSKGIAMVSEREQIVKPLLRKANERLSKCYCGTKCMAPVIMGRQTPCLRGDHLPTERTDNG